MGINFLCPSCYCEVKVIPAKETRRPTKLEEAPQMTLNCPLCGDKMIKGVECDMWFIETTLRELAEAMKSLEYGNSLRVKQIKQEHQAKLKEVE